MENWHWLRTYYFEPCKDALILDGIWPAVESVHRETPGSAAYFQRDWWGGPHVLLGLCCSDSDVNELATRIRTYITSHPSCTELSGAEVTRRMESLRVKENKTAASLLQPQPNNAVRIEKNEPYSPFLTQDLLKYAVREFLSKTSAFAVYWLELVRAGKVARSEICMRAMIALAWLADPEELRPHLSFNSHTRAFLHASDHNGYLARAFAAKYDGFGGERIRLLLSDSVQALRENVNGLLRMREFVELLRETMADIYIGLGSGRYKPVPAATLVGNPDRGSINYSRLIELLDAHPALRAWQITISLLYQVLNQLGMQAAERFLACYMLSRAAEDLFGKSADLIYESLNRSGDHRDMFTFFADLDAANAASA